MLRRKGDQCKLMGDHGDLGMSETRAGALARWVKTGMLGKQAGLSIEAVASELEWLQAQADELQKTVGEADRRAGAAERQLAHEREASAARGTMAATVLLSTYVVRVPTMWRQAPITAAIVIGGALQHHQTLSAVEQGLSRVARSSVPLRNGYRRGVAAVEAAAAAQGRACEGIEWHMTCGRWILPALAFRAVDGCLAASVMRPPYFDRTAPLPDVERVTHTTDGQPGDPERLLPQSRPSPVSTSWLRSGRRV